MDQELEKRLDAKLTPSELARKKRNQEARTFANNIIEQCQQRDFTVAQFCTVIEVLDFKMQLLKNHAADITGMKD